ncbi:DUF2269 domain-containing protein [Ruegeria sp. 2012CJ41-6]|uniref:DUF2269 domain-containing protein n=1 Tax=Ruegeria spongiae TaxID=2942209 RepID=A0ABT0Q204_9RHOB|nr:DUF2269 domain-containing protein [Ruegeria spongiae]MCL6283860.1 DUF2269 domain-containing protein [Ruegeria spongiae]
MIDPDMILRWLHVIGACVLLGTGAGIAFFMLMAVRSRNPVVIAEVATIVVFADLIFTAIAVIAQPVTGLLMAHRLGWDLSEGWLLVAIGLYVFTGLFWLPVVWIQLRLRDLARLAAAQDAPLPQDFDRLFRIWVLCGVPAFLAVLAILWLMLARPDIPLWT